MRTGGGRICAFAGIFVLTVFDYPKIVSEILMFEIDQVFSAVVIS